MLGIREPRMAVLGAKDEMHDDLGKGLRRSFRCPHARWGSQETGRAPLPRAGALAGGSRGPLGLKLHGLSKLHGTAQDQ